jgi:cyclopropane fatty-acyl-phospholipid synthase-like methyltransferase
VPRLISAVAVLALSYVPLSAQRPNQLWEDQYRQATPEAMAAQFENPARAVFRYRTAIVGMLQLKPGMSVAEIGAGSGFLARMMAAGVGPSGRVVATELQATMVDLMNARAKAQGLDNFRAVLGKPATTALDRGSADAVAIVEAFSYFDHPREMLTDIHSALKPGGLLLIVDLPREGQGASQVGIDADDVLSLAAAAGFRHVDELGVVPGHYALRFRRP